MALKPVVADLNTIAEPLRSLYEPKDGKFVLALDGAPAGYVPEADVSTLKNQIAEFRENNRGLNAIKTDLEGKLKAFDGVDSEEYKALKAKADELARKGVKGGDDIQKLIEAGIASATAPVIAELKQFKEAAGNAQKQLAQKDLEAALTTAGIKAGVADSALPDYVARGLRTWSVEEGKHVAKGSDGTTLRKSGEPVTMEQWAADLATEAPHLYKSSKGGSTPPGPGGNGNGNGAVRTISADAKLTAQDLKDIASGSAVRGEAAA